MTDKNYSNKYKNKNDLTELFLLSCSICNKALDYDNYHEMECGHKIHLECYEYLSKVKIKPDTLCIKCQKEICIVM